MTAQDIAPYAATILALIFAAGAFWCANADRKSRIERREKDVGEMPPPFRRLVHADIESVPRHDRANAIRAARFYCGQWQAGVLNLAQAVSRTKSHLRMMASGVVVREPTPKPEPGELPEWGSGHYWESAAQRAGIQAELHRKAAGAHAGLKLCDMGLERIPDSFTQPTGDTK
jgi:hypothetical protein